MYPQTIVYHQRLLEKLIIGIMIPSESYLWDSFLFSPPTSFFTNSMQKFERTLFYQTQGWSKKDNPPATLWTSHLVFMKKAPIKIASCSYNCTF